MKKFTHQIHDLPLIELQELQRNLKVYQKMIHELGERGKKLFNKKETGEKTIVVEYYPKLNTEFVEEYAKEIVQNIFHISGETNIQYKEVENIGGGMRVFVDDQVLDLTYGKIERQFQK